MSDVDGKVTGLQGNPVKVQTLGSLEDGYDLTWKDGYWQALPKAVASGGLRKEYFTSSGTWTCPEGVTTVLLIGAGGGAGGSGGYGRSSSGSAGAGGGGSLQLIKTITVVPNTSYTVNIGNGGAGGIGSKTTQPDNWTPPTVLIDLVPSTSGEDTYFNDGSNTLFKAKGGSSTFAPDLFDGTFQNGNKGSNAPTGGTHTGGGLGQLGPQGNGGNGGNGVTAYNSSLTTAGNGSSASSNSGAGGGGGGGTETGVAPPWNLQGGNGGNGGSGYLYIIY